ncbi:MAG: response regulator [Ignavibacteriales bacterium]|nr:response regulator [Ignavibacteriales bacterium]
MHTILMIEDDEVQLALQRSILMDAGYKLFATADGPQGITIFQKHKIDLVLLDLGLASMSGLEVLREIRRIDDKAKVIVITGYPSVESSVIAMKYGAIDYIQKPFDVKGWLKRIRAILEDVKI